MDERSPAASPRLRFRRAFRVTGAFVPAQLWVDSTLVGVLHGGQSVAVTVLPGRHVVNATMRHPADDTSITVELEAGDAVTVTVWAKLWNGRVGIAARRDST